MGGGGKSEPISYDGIPFSKVKKGNFKALKYGLALSEGELTKTSIQKLVDVMNRPSNENGSELKVILGTKVVAEGIDFKGLRQIHIMEPWFNLSINEQIIGRGTRNCSHMHLPPELRNIEIFQYASIPPSTVSKKLQETETVDIKNYRMSENKDRKIKEIERILKVNAIDCGLNKTVNVPATTKLVSQKTASGMTVKVSSDFKPYSRECDYSDTCSYKCTTPTPTTTTPNTSTYTLNFAKDDIEKAKKYIRLLFRHNYIYNIAQIRNEVLRYLPELDNTYIYLALDQLVNSNETIYDKFSRAGYIIYRGDYYIYQPKSINYENIPMYYRRTPLTFKVQKYDYTQYVDSKPTQIVTELSFETVMTRLMKKYEESKTIFEKFINENISEKYRTTTLLMYNLVQLSNNENLKLIQTFLTTKKLKFKNEFAKIYSRIIIKKKAVCGFFFDGVCYTLVDDKLKICEPETQKILESKQVKKKNKANVLGIYLTKLKIVDQRSYTGAVTLKQKTSKRSLLTGRTCTTFSVSLLTEILASFKLKFAYGKKKKLCSYIMLILIYYELKSAKNYFISKFS